MGIMIGPLNLIASFVALLLVSVLLVALSASPAEADPGSAPAPDTLPAPHEWVMVVLLFALVIAFHHCRTTLRQRA
jgi:hypothetical protein